MANYLPIPRYNPGMRKTKIRGGILAVTVLAVLGAAFAGAIYWFSQPTKGARITSYAKPRTAVLVVDMQEDYTGPRAKLPYSHSETLVSRVNRVLEIAKRRGWDVVFIRNEVAAWNLGSRLATRNTGVRGTPGAAVDARLLRPAGSVEVTKWKADAFSAWELNELLVRRQVGILMVVGIDAAACAGATIRGALNRGYAVTVPADCVATRLSRPLSVLLDDYRTAGAQVVMTAEELAGR